jgi:hypothetical protein
MRDEEGIVSIKLKNFPISLDERKKTPDNLRFFLMIRQLLNYDIFGNMKSKSLDNIEKVFNKYALEILRNEEEGN